MSRIFSPKYEVNSIHEGVEKDLQRFAGTRAYWYRFDPDNTVVDDTYDYGYPSRWKTPPIPVDVVDAIRVEGGQQVYEQGLYTRDRLKLIVSWRELERRGLAKLTGDVQVFLKDRFTYDGFVFSPVEINVMGQIQEWNTVVTINAVEVRPDELVNDATFSEVATKGTWVIEAEDTLAPVVDDVYGDNAVS